MNIYGVRVLLRLVLLVVVILHMTCVVADGNVFYVFIDKNGKTRIQDTISVELAEFGYRVINARGVTLEVVLPRSEIIALIQQQKQNKKKKELRSLQRTIAEQNFVRDKALVETFSSVNDIIAARNRKTDALQGIITVTLTNIASFEMILDKMKAQSERHLERKQEVPEKLQLDMQTVRRQIKGGRDFIQRKRGDLGDVQKRSEQDVTRFKAILVEAEKQQ